jgi:hypothetical protein
MLILFGQTTSQGKEINEMDADELVDTYNCLNEKVRQSLATESILNLMGRVKKNFKAITGKNLLDCLEQPNSI